MSKERKTAMVPVRVCCLSAALWLLIAVAAVQASPTAAPVNIDPPTITGTARVGEVLTAHNGTWDNAPTSYRYRWLRCNRGGNNCVLLASDGETYRVGQADVGSTLRVRVTAVNADGATNARSEQTEVVGSNAAPLTNTARPTITGEARVGQELTARRGRGRATRPRSPSSGSGATSTRSRASTSPVLPVAHTAFGLPTSASACGCRSTARTDGRSGTATSNPTAVVQPTTPVTNARPTLRILKVTFLGARIYVRFRVCDDQPRNLGILVRETRPGVRPALRRFATRVPPRPCGAYTRSWLPAQRFRGPGRYTITLRARDCLGQDEPAGAAHVPSIAPGRCGWHRAAARCQPLPVVGEVRLRREPRASAARLRVEKGVTAAPPGAPGASTASRSAVPDSYLRTRHWLPRLRTRAPIGSSPRVDRYSTSPSGNRSIRIGVVGI